MVRRRSVDLLPEIFRTNTNKKFLSATLDQLTQEPQLKRTQGYIGRRIGPGVNPNDNYVIEPTGERANYQLEPGVIFLKPDTNQAQDAMTYPGFLDSIDLAGGTTQQQDRLWKSQFYTWDPFCDFDKLVNYSQYYWLPGGPDSVDISSTSVPLTDDFDVTTKAQGDVLYYDFSGLTGENPVVTLVRGGTYRFDINQPGNKFWIQSAPGVDGRLPGSPNISSRDVFGVVNNGTDGGTVTFNVPLRTGQDFYYSIPEVAEVDLICGLKFNEVNNIYVSEFLSKNPKGIDGILNLDQRTLIFTNSIADAQDGGWQITTMFDPLPRDDAFNGQIGSFDSTTYDQTTDINDQSQRYSVWRVNYVYDDSNQPYISLISVRPVAKLTKFNIGFGTQYSSTSWYKNAEGLFEQVPLLTAIQDTLYYQDGSNPEIFGRIQLVDSGNNIPVDINDIVGAKTYTSRNGVVFTNGLKVQFRGPTVPAFYQDREFYVEGVGSGPGLDQRVGFVDGEAYFGTFHSLAGQKLTGLPGTGTFQQFIYNTVEESLANIGRGAPEGAPLPAVSQINPSQGNGIKLIPVRELITPETYTRNATIPYDSTPYDATPYDSALNSPLIPDYITINRSSQDRNAWSRSNRWFHIDVIRYTAELNNSEPIIDNQLRAKRPIIEFRSNLDLWNSGTQAKLPVDIIDLQQTDALSNINGTIGYSIDGYNLIEGSRVVFAKDEDLQVRNRVYKVTFIDPDGNPNSPKIINLVPAADGQALTNQSLLCMSGNTLQGISFWFDGVEWIQAQQKSGVNQAPLFDIFDQRGRSLGNNDIYPSTNFRGTKLFGYALGGTQTSDEVLGFTLKYQNINNIGDIVFENYLYTDEFSYVNGGIGVTEKISQGFVREYIDRVSFGNQIGWQTAVGETRSRQVFRFIYDGSPLILDVPADQSSVYPALQVFVSGVFLDPATYSISVQGLNTFVTLPGNIDNGAVVEVQALSNIASALAFYQVPSNLESNAFNENSNGFTLGTLRTHYESIGQNLKNISGPINGANNTRDLGNIIPFGENIIQHSSPLTLAGVFQRQPQFDIFGALTFNDQEYSKYKAQILDLAAKGDFINSSASTVLDTVIEEISLRKNETSPFYWSDMIPAGSNFTEIQYTITPITTNVFDLTQVYDFDSSNFKGLLVYLNDRLLTKKYDYTVGDDSPTITITADLNTGDIVKIREYAATYGSFVPNTPTKLGLYPAFRPEIYLDSTYVDPTLVIRGHDGSITVAYGDIRDQVMLEFETRIFNNLKVSEDIPMSYTDVIPGQFRVTDYPLSEINQILAQDFLSWVGWNKLDYITQTYINNNEFTYNYSQSGDRLTGKTLLGAWRGIYNYFYDTLTPNTRPWEMLGFSEPPVWWESIYGPAPYTSGNLVLWDDLEAGIVRDPMGSYVIPRYARPGLTRVIPSGSEGELLSPLVAVVGNYDDTSFRRSWTFGDDGPTENAWRTSSSWPFAVMRLLALTRPAEFFSLGVDRDRYQYDTILGQWLWDGRYRLNASALAPLYGQGTSRASYIDWIIDFNQQQGLDSTRALTQSLSNLDVRLCWRAAGYTDKKYLRVYAERSTPTGSNAGLLLPDESYQILLYKNQPFEQALYSSVIIQKVEDGWSVLGYNINRPFFPILVSRSQGVIREITSGNSSVRVPVQYTDQVTRVPYGYVFKNRTAVCDFLLSYGELLTRQGFQFEGLENGYIMDWNQMAQEFLYWSNQGWIPGSLINLNPGATKISVTQENTVAESLLPPRADNLILNQNRQPLGVNDLVIDRLDNTFSVSVTGQGTISYLNLRLTAYEHLVILDNRSIFADLIYDPSTGARQSRVLISGMLSAGWNGTVNAPGFIINENNIEPWKSNQKYSKGEIVTFKNQYWVASTIIEPSAEFNYSLWVKSDRDEVQQGLLPNAPNSSDQLTNAYDIFSANLDTEVDLFSYGLIGFRPREYMEALNLDDVSQVNLYQQFLGTKGTRSSAEIFSLADLGKEVAEYRIYEYWATLLSTYGANANRSYFEILLNEPRLIGDPSIIQIINPGESSQADQTVLLENLWKESFKIPSIDILPTLTEPLTDIALPSAGYVNLDDVDITLFDINDPQLLAPNLSKIGVGTTIWVAKVNPYDWDVYGCRKIPGQIVQISDNLDGLSLVTFNQAHGLSVGDYIIIRFFDAAIDGAYQVSSVTGIFSVLIPYTFVGDQTDLTGTGLGLTLESIRVAQPSDVAKAEYANTIQPGTRVWVDRDAQGNWSVIEKTDVFQTRTQLEVAAPVSGSQFGASISQGFFNLTALIGAPGYNPGGLPSAPGAVYAFGKGDTSDLKLNGLVLPEVTDAVDFGRSVDVGNQSWAVVGAPGSDSDLGYASILFRETGSDLIQQTQLLVSPPPYTEPSRRFGESVTMSQDEKWLYVGAPDASRVYAYARVSVQNQIVEYVTDGISTQYNWADHIKADLPNQQIDVVLNNQILSNPNDWLVVGDNIALTSRPPAGFKLVIIRRFILQLDQEFYPNVAAQTVTGTGTGAKFDVFLKRGQYSLTIVDGGSGYQVNDTLTIPGSLVGGTTINIQITNLVGNEYRGTLTAGLPTFNVNSVSGLFVGQEIVKLSGDGDFPAGTVTITDITAPATVTVNANNTASGFVRFYQTPGPVTSFNFSPAVTPPLVDTFQISNKLATVSDIYSFTVRVGSRIYRPFLDYSYNQITGEIVFDGTNPPVGSTIQVTALTYYQLIDELEVDTSVSGDGFGSSVTTTTDGRQIIIGAPLWGENDGDPIAASALSQDQEYQITAVGDTDFVAIGASSNTVGVIFTATGSGSGTGTAARFIRTGRSYVFDRSYEKFIVDDADRREFTVIGSLQPVVAVRVNGVSLINDESNIGGQFVIISPDTVEVSVPLSVGDTVEVDTNNFVLIENLQSDSPFRDAGFGAVVDQCINDCSLYVSSPLDGKIVPQGGKVEFFQNQSRIYGTTASTSANPVLTPGEYIRINGFAVENTGTTIEELVETINKTAINGESGIPNVEAVLTTDLTLTGDGVTTRFAVGDIYSSASQYNTLVKFGRNESSLVVLTPGVDYVYDAQNRIIDFTEPVPENWIAKVISGRMILRTKNPQAGTPLNLLSVLPIDGHALFDDLMFETYVWQQTITAPVSQDYAKFGSSLFISDDTETLIIGAPNASQIEPMSFDGGTTIFDAKSTNFSTVISNSGAVYVYDFLPSYETSVSNPGQFVFGQQIIEKSLNPLDGFGTAVDLTTGTLLVGSPGNDLGDTQLDYGSVFQLENSGDKPAWKITRQQRPTVDVSLLNSVYIYDIASGQVNAYLDYFDPLQGKLLGVVRQNLNYIGAIDPAQYNVGVVNNRGQRWGQEHVGEMWWNTDNARFIDPNQDDVVYASRRWGQLFPGSTVDVYQWVSSPVPPADYTGPGQPRSVASYCVTTQLSEQGIFEDVYFFWVSGIRAVNRSAKKTLGAQTVAQYIENPRSSGLPYLAPLAPNAVAIYNSLTYINDINSALHIEYDRQRTDNAVHVEYQLIADGRSRDFLNDTLYRKLIDSFAGSDLAGNSVPDPLLSPSEKYGVNIRPRQSFFANRFLALKNYLTKSNEILKGFPAAERRESPLLNSAEPQPPASSKEWNKKVANLEELSFQDLRQVDLGYRYLVESDSSNRGLWTIYETISGDVPGSKTLMLIRVQNYDTRLYWNFVDWYSPAYDPSSRILLEVNNTADLETIDVPNGSSVRVRSNAQGKWEIYLRENLSWTRVGLQSGTIEFSDVLWDYQKGRYGFDSEVFDSQYYDQEPNVETRQIIRAINEEIFVGELLIERNQLLMLMFDYILSEQENPSWLGKTSLIDVDHVIRELLPFQIYRQDNQNFVLDYIKEIKPYHTQIREFNLIYQGQDQYQGTVTDFDLPATWDPAKSLFVSPILDDGDVPVSTTSSFPSSSPIWTAFPYDQWYQNYLLSIESVVVVDPGQGYTVPPEVQVIGEAIVEAKMRARINSAGRVVDIIIDEAGSGYTTTATILLVGGNGIGAKAVARMGNQLVRNLTTTIKYDRYQYSSDIKDWISGISYDSKTRVRFDDRVWQAISDIPAQQDFDPLQWDLIPPGDLSGVDRTMGYYVPTPDQPGLDLALLISGVDYPGVQVFGLGFDYNPGFDSGSRVSPSFDPPPSIDPLYIDGVRDVTWATIYEPDPTNPGTYRPVVDPERTPGQIFTPKEWCADRYIGGLGFDTDPYDNLSYGPEGRPTYDPILLDAIYESDFLDPYLGVNPSTGAAIPDPRPGAIEVNGGGFVDTYSSHAPEELVPGAIFDTLDLRVFTTPGSDWDGDGHGFPTAVYRYEFESSSPVLNYAGSLDYPVTLNVFNVTTGTALYPMVQYSVDWVNYTVTIISGVSNGNIVSINIAEIGGGNQLITETFVGDGETTRYHLPRGSSDIFQTVVFVNGQQITGFSVVPVNPFEVEIILDSPLTTAQRLTVTLLGYGSVVNRSWSLPITQYWVSDGSTSLALVNSLQGTNPANIVVTRNGRRATPSAGIEYLADGIENNFALPARSGYSLDLVADNDVSVYINNTALTLGTEFFLDPYDLSSESRSVTLTSTPAAGSKILISVRTGAQYFISGNILQFRASAGFLPLPGDVIGVTTWNDTSEQNILTEVFVGPETQGILVSQGYDTTEFDEADIINEPGSYDYSEGQQIKVNRFDLGRVITRSDRLLVSLDGRFLFEDYDYSVEDREILLLGPPISDNSILSVTLLAQSTIPGALAFRIFQDMRGRQNIYRITPETTTRLSLPLGKSDEVIFVEDASRLPVPDLAQGIFGLVTIDGEKISYRTLDTINNTVSGLRRGVSGTGAADHAISTPVYDISIGNLLPSTYQNRIIRNDSLADGNETVFVASGITLDSLSSSEITESVRVFVGGLQPTQTFNGDSVTRTFELDEPLTQYTVLINGDVPLIGYTINNTELIFDFAPAAGDLIEVRNYAVTSPSPVTIEFSEPPNAGYQVTIAVDQAQSIYRPGPSTPSDGVPLQETDTVAARFIRGQ